VLVDARTPITPIKRAEARQLDTLASDEGITNGIESRLEGGSSQFLAQTIDALGHLLNQLLTVKGF